MKLNLNLSSPKELTFIISAAIAVLTLLGQVVALPIFSAYGFGLLLIAYILLTLGVLLRDL